MKKLKKATILSLVCILVALATGCGKGSADGKTHLTFQIWDVNQSDGMQAVCDAYTAQHPDVVVEVQVTSWNEYWTKLEAAAISNQMPDIFWMHTNEILKYADYGKIADVTDLYDEAGQPGYFQEHFSEVSLSNIQGSDGRYYGIPKDKDTVGLVYNKEMFDAAKVSYPDETWTWDDLCEASQKIYDATGKYGYMAYGDDQLGYWNFVYQNGGSILAEDKIHGGFDQQATQDAMRFYMDLQKNDWCPDQNYFAETSPGTAFFSEQGAMYFEGNWNVLANMQNYPNMQGKWDVAVLPKCPNPANGDGRATISNGLCYATSPTGKNYEIVKDLLRFMGSEEGQRVQGESGAAIPAYIGLEDTWVGVFDQFDYKMNVACFTDMFEYGVQSVNNKYRPTWKTQVSDNLLKIYSGQISFEDGMKAMQNAVNNAALED